MRNITSEGEVEIIAETRTGGIRGSIAECGRKTLSFDSEKLSTNCYLGLIINCNICDKLLM